jgi:Xaa-Pro aminopeptidase
VEAAEKKLQRQLRGIREARQRSHDQELEDLHRRLLDLRQQHVARTLAAYTVNHPSLHGIDHSLRSALAYYGFHSAFDIVNYSITWTQGRNPRPIALLHHRNGATIRVRGIGPQRAQRLLDWRNWVVQQAETSSPQSLPKATEAAIRNDFRRQRLALDDDERQAQRTAADDSEEAARALRDRLADLGQELRKIQERAAAERLRIDAELPVARKGLDEARWQSLMAERAFFAYQRISFWGFVAGALRRRMP